MLQQIIFSEYNITCLLGLLLRCIFWHYNVSCNVLFVRVTHDTSNMLSKLSEHSWTFLNGLNCGLCDLLAPTNEPSIENPLEPSWVRTSIESPRFHHRNLSCKPSFLWPFTILIQPKWGWNERVGNIYKWLPFRCA